MRKNLETNKKKNGNRRYPNIRYSAKAVLRGKLIMINVYIKKKKDFK